jgi:hypothetical protein
MRQATNKLFPGDLVEVKSPREILATLDADGTLDKLPFMPEMIEHCGKRFRVSRRVLKICTSGSGSSMRAFRNDDVVFLDGVRCSGTEHDGCQKDCTIFWREAWLRKVDEESVPATTVSPDKEQLRRRLKTLRSPNTYFCQASELLIAAEPLSRRERFTKCFSDIRARNVSVPQMTTRIAIWLFWKIRRTVVGVYARGANKSTPVETLNLQPGELVEVKPMASIIETLNQNAHNRGLWFSPDMRLLCGRQRKVERRIDKIIVDGTGEMRSLHNTVYLEGSMCACPHVAFGGCSRGEFVYWREIWLRRVANS